MVLIANDTQHPYYVRSDLHCMNMLVRPVWVFDIDNKAMFWANAAAIEQVWNASTLDELLQRDFASDMSEATASFLAGVKSKIIQDPYRSKITEQWTFYPRDGESATTFDITCSGIRIGDTSDTSAPKEGRIAMLVEAEMLLNERTLNESTIRSIELLKHIPVAVSQFTLDGTKLIYQNPKASQLFGNPPGRESFTTDLNNSSNDLNVAVDTPEQSNDESDVTASAKRRQPLDETLKEPPNSNTMVNALLERFVDTELGKQAIVMISEKDEEFSAEVQLYTTLRATPESSARDRKRSYRDKTTNDTRLHRWFNVSLRKTRDPVTSDFVILYIARDISDIVKARMDSVRAAMKSEFLDVMAHEIRTPLHQIVGHTDLLEDTFANGIDSSNPLRNEQLVSVRQIQSSCSMLISIINDLLDCSKLENGLVQIEKIQFDLDSLIHTCIESMRPQAQLKKDLQLLYLNDSVCDITKLISDPSRIRQVLHNLLSNAIKFSSIGSVTVTIRQFTRKRYNSDINSANTSDPLGLSESSSSAAVSNDHSTAPENSCNTQHLLFEVTDTGIGIAPSEQKIVFERYRQANASVARSFGGTGLGLPICKGIVELLGGTIGLRSEVGIGTTVYFDIPFKVDPEIGSSTNVDHSETSTRTLDQCAMQNVSPMVAALSEALPKASVPPPLATLSAGTNLTGLNILVVEDNLVNQKVVNSMLKRLGHAVSVAENGKIALGMIHEKQFDLVLMDVQMPIMDGIECTKHIRNVLQYDKDFLPIIGLTAGYQPAESDYYENDIGMNCCLGKPLPMNKLKEAIQTYCRRQTIQSNAIAQSSVINPFAPIDFAHDRRNLVLLSPAPFVDDTTSVIGSHKRELEASTGNSSMERSSKKVKEQSNN